jgi:hypothetical protein
MYLVTLIVVGGARLPELQRLLNTIDALPECQSIEVIVVGQSRRQDFYDLLKNRKAEIKLIDVGSVIPISKARNIALKARPRGAYVGFPDDDCWYHKTSVSDVLRGFRELKTAYVLCGCVWDPLRECSYGLRPRNKIVQLSDWNIFRLPVSVGIFFRSEVFDMEPMGFSEEIGAGTKVGSGEETEFLARLLRRGLRGYYDGRIVVYHEIETLQSRSYVKAKKYGVGFGYTVWILLRRGQWRVVGELACVVVLSVGGLVRSVVFGGAEVQLGRLFGIGLGIVLAALHRSRL